MRGTIRPTTTTEALERAYEMLRYVGVPPGAPHGTAPSPIGYRLEPGFNGGSDPLAKVCGSPSYGDRVWTSDCIGFVLWCLGIDRMQPAFKGMNGPWLNCASVLQDAKGAAVYFKHVLDGASAGDCLLSQTHIGLIIRPAVGDFDHLVMDCSPRHGRKTAIGIGGPWDDSCIAVRYQRFI